MSLQTIPLSWAVRQASGAVESGLVLDRLFERALITPQFGDDRDRISPLQLTLFYASLIHDTGDGMHLMARRRLPTEVGQLALRVLMGSRQLGDGLEAMAKFYRMCFPSLHLNLLTDGDLAFLALQFQDDRPEALLQEDVQLAYLYLGLTAFVGRPFPLSWIATRDPSHMNIDGSHWALKCRVKLQACAGMAFPKSLLTSRPQADDTSDLVWDPVETWISYIEDASSSVATGANNRDFRVDRMASEKGVAPSTYRRMVTRSDRGFREMRERALIQASVELIQNGASSLDDIADALGYSDERSLRRFVKRVTGLTPTELRQASAGFASASELKALPSIMSELRGLNSTTALCLRFIILTWTRSSEARGARWSEIDEKSQLWSIPALRMKASKPHDVPLNEEALEIVGTMKKRRTKSDLVFPGSTGGVLSDVGLNKVLHSLPTIARLDAEAAVKSEHFAKARSRIRGATVHGMRSSARSWAAAQTEFAPFVAELALAHVNKDRVEAAYQRDRVLEKRAALLKAWGDYCFSGNVLPFERRVVR